VRPSALAVLRLMTSSYLVGNSTGRSTPKIFSYPQQRRPITPSLGQKVTKWAASLGARYRQNRHDLHGISGKNREVRMLLEQLGGSVM
jgi:hypothetical protein